MLLHTCKQNLTSDPCWVPRAGHHQPIVEEDLYPLPSLIKGGPFWVLEVFFFPEYPLSLPGLTSGQWELPLPPQTCPGTIKVVQCGVISVHIKDQTGLLH